QLVSTMNKYGLRLERGAPRRCTLNDPSLLMARRSSPVNCWGHPGSKVCLRAGIVKWSPPRQSVLLEINGSYRDRKHAERVQGSDYVSSCFVVRCVGKRSELGASSRSRSQCPL